MTAPLIYGAINAISADLASSGVAKTRVNAAEDYTYRSIDDVMDALAPLLARHRLCVLPTVLERLVTERSDDQQHLLINVALKVAFSLTSVEDGSSHTIIVYGEALDAGDKATAKAMSAAYKAAMVQAFCIPVGRGEDADRTSHRLAPRGHSPEPLQGWRQWCLDIEDIVGLCESETAIATLKERHRDLLKALSREQPQLYAELGQAFVSRHEVLKARAVAAKARSARSRRAKATVNRSAEQELASA